jgi:hypothetical protein
MNHNEATQLGAAEKYVLRELADEQREAFEDHFFNCTECNADVRAAMIFADAAGEVFAEPEQAKFFKAEPQASWVTGWFEWFRRFAAAPVAAGLVLLVGYQNIVTIPQARRGSGQTENRANASVAAVQAYDTSFTLAGVTRGGRRGEASDADVPSDLRDALPAESKPAEMRPAEVKVRADESFALNFEFTPTQKFEAYTGALVDDGGRTVLQVALAGELTNKDVHVTVPAGVVRGGRYALVIRGVAPAQSAAESAAPVARLVFTVEILQ